MTLVYLSAYPEHFMYLHSMFLLTKCQQNTTKRLGLIWKGEQCEALFEGCPENLLIEVSFVVKPRSFPPMEVRLGIHTTAFVFL